MEQILGYLGLALMLGLAGIAVALLVVALPFVAIGLIIYSIIN